MKITKLLLGAVVLLLIGGFAYLAVTDVPVEKTEVSKVISNERFFNGN